MARRRRNQGLHRDVATNPTGVPAPPPGEGSDAGFDRLAGLASHLLKTPMAFVALFEGDRMRVVGNAGAKLDEIAQSSPINLHVAVSGRAIVIPDALADHRFDSDALLGAPLFARFYAGVPLLQADGRSLGSLFVIDYLPRAGLDVGDIDALADLATLAVQELRQGDKIARTEAIADFVNALELAMVTVDQAGNIAFANPAMTGLLGYERHELVGKPVEIIVPERLQSAHRAGLARVVAGGETTLAGRTVEVVARRRDGSEVPVELLLSVWRDGGGVNMGAVVRDVTERHERDTRLLRLAHHDTLTGLCNRHRYGALLAEALEQHLPAAVMLVGIDGFKEVTDNIGHVAADALLQSVAIRLLSLAPADATLARFSGDQFAILLPGTADPDTVRLVADQILMTFDQPFETELHALHLCASIGFSLAFGAEVDAEQLLARADVALLHARRDGNRGVRMFDSEMQREAADTRAVIDELRRAFRDEEFELHYQPQILLETGKVHGVEALLRWRHPTRGLLSPADFIPTLEGSSLALPVGWWVLEEACRQAASWRRGGMAGLKMGVNLFAEQFRSPLLVRQVHAALEKHGLEPSALELEITETIALSNDDNSAAAMRDLRGLGVNIAFDDFGTGFASLSSLQRFPLTTLKIDQSFVSGLVGEPRAAAIVRALVTMGNELGLSTIAEGIETAEQETVLHAFGCKVGQGYRFGRPGTARDFETAMRGGKGE